MDKVNLSFIDFQSSIREVDKMNPDRKHWNQQQQALRLALSRHSDHHTTIELFLNQHAMVHSAMMTNSGLWSFEDEIWQDLTEDAARCIPRNGEHSIAWLIWHIARIEDVTMNLLVAGSQQLLNRDRWLERMQITVRDTGNAMNMEGVAYLSATIDLPALRAYRMAVGSRTREIVQQLGPEDMKRKVEQTRLQQVIEEGAVIKAGREVIEYWGGLTIAGLLLMPPTRHNFIHLNEALRIKPHVM